MKQGWPRRAGSIAKSVFIGVMAGIGIMHTSRVVISNYNDSAQKTPDFDQQLADFGKVLLDARGIAATDASPEKMMEGALDGALKALDPHSLYLNAEEFQRLMTATEGEYAGIGMSIAPAGQVTVVIAPTDDTPAARAGVKSGDFIYKVNGQSVIGKSSQQVADLIKGRPGSTVELILVRDGAELPVMSLTREIIKTHAVTKTALIGDIGYIRLATYENENAAEEMRAAVAALETESQGRVKGFIIDQRDNPGGLVPQVVQIADDFLDGNQTIMSMKGRLPGPRYNQTYRAQPGDIANGKPLAVLINRGSASASEIFAAALQDNGRAEIIGEQSFGKGSGQSVIPLARVFNDPSRKDGILVTTFLHHRPQGATIQNHGVTPNLTFVADPNAKKPWRPAEAEMSGTIVNPGQVAPAIVRNDGTCGAVDVKLSPDGLDRNLVGRDGKPDFQLMCGVEFLQKAAGQAPAGHIKIAPPQKLTSIEQAAPVIR